MAFDPPRSINLQRHWRRLTLTCLAVLAAGFLLPFAVSEPAVDENRPLATPPPPPRTLAALGAWPAAMEAYVSDNFPARKQLIATLNYLRYRAGVSGSGRVLIGRDGWLFYEGGDHLGPARNVPVFTDADARLWLQQLAGRTEWLKARGVRYLVLAGPDKEVIEAGHGPAWYAGPELNRPATLLTRLNDAAQAGDLVYPGPVLQQQAHWGLQVYNPYETHWTGLGAYFAYVQVMQRLAAMGVTGGPRPLEAFRELPDTPSKPRNLSRMLGIASFVDADYPQFLDPALTPNTTWLTAKQVWTAPQVIDTGQAGKPVLLMVRDSFSLALLPFLEGHFSRIVLVHHQEGRWRPDLVARFKPDVVISEVIESGLPFIMADGPPASAAARARIDQALARPHRLTPPPPGRAASTEVITPTHRIEGTAGPDVIRGTLRGDAINGGAGNDRIEGLWGDDVLRGGRGDDRLSGGRGRDWISGDLGDDTLSGGPGADIFRIAPGFGDDLATDFSAAEGDQVEIPRNTAYAVRQQDADTVITLDGARLVLRGVKAASLPEGWIFTR
jgi:hypothetical protein